MSRKENTKQSQRQQQHYNPGSGPFIHNPIQAILGNLLGEPKASVAIGWGMHQ